MSAYVDFCKAVEMTGLDENPPTIGSISASSLSAIQYEWTIPDFLSNFYFGIYKSPTFLFLNHSWYLRMFPTKQHISVYLYTKDPASGDICFTVQTSLKKSNGQLETGESKYCVLKKSQSYTGLSHSWKRSNLMRQKSELLPSGKLTLVLTCSATVTVPDEVKQITGLESLSENLENLFNTKSHSDITLKVKSKKFHVHKVILVARSPVFAAAFEHKMLEKEKNEYTIEDCDPDPFWDFLQYLYTGKVTEDSLKNVLQLYITADKYNVSKLKSYCVSHMMQNLTVENVCSIVNVANQYEETGLLCSAQAFFNRNTSEILATAYWDTLMETNSHLANKLIKGMVSDLKLKK